METLGSLKRSDWVGPDIPPGPQSPHPAAEITGIGGIRPDQVEHREPMPEGRPGGVAPHGDLARWRPSRPP
jgi:hypothetical protein